MPIPPEPTTNDTPTGTPTPDRGQTAGRPPDEVTGGSPSAAEAPTAEAALADKAKAAYAWWDHLATFHPDDPWWLGGLKIGFRAVGVVLLLALSPVIILGILVGFAAVL